MKWTRHRWCATPWNRVVAPQPGRRAGRRPRAGPRTAHASSARSGTPARTPPPEGAPPVLTVTDVHTKDLPAPVGGDPGGHHHGLGGQLSAGRGVGTHVQVGRVHIDVRELGEVQPSGPERPHRLVQPLADAGDLGLRDPGPAHRHHQVAHRAVDTPCTYASITTAYRAWSIRRRGSSTDGKIDPARSLGIDK